MKKTLYVALGLVLALGLVISLAGCGAGPGSNLPSGGRMVALDVAEPAPPAQPTSYTDKTDYAPGDTVAFIGSGFQPGETVNIEAVGAPWGTALTATLTADDSGAISGQLTLPEAFEDTYTLTATGATSGLVGQTSITDSSGAIWTTNSSCETVNQNPYPSKDAVYLNGGPDKSPHNGLPDGDYYVQVTEPDGALLGSTPTASVHVTNGNFDQCYQLWAILTKPLGGQGYDDTTNPGGEYKVWVSKNPEFPNSESKTDNFKVVAVTPPPVHGTATITTEVYNADDIYIPPDGDVPLGTIVYDTATVTGEAGKPAPTGNMTFNLYKGMESTGTLMFSDTEPVGTQSIDSLALHAGDYVFQATYNGDTVYDPVTSGYEHFVVDKGTVTLATTIYNAADDTVIPLNSHVALGTSAYDKVMVTGNTIFFNIADVTYKFNGAAAGNGAKSDTKGPLHAGNYAFQAFFAGNDDYNAAESDPEPFVVGKGTVTLATTIYNAADDTVIPLNSHVALGTSAYDKVTVTGETVFFNIADVTYKFDGAAAGSGAKSDTKGPLHAGGHHFQAFFAGNDDYNAAESADEPFVVDKGTVTLATTIYNAADDTVIPLNSHVALTTSAYDNVTVTGETVFFNIADVTYKFDGAAAGSGAKSDTKGPLHAGNHGFQAFFAGNDDYYSAESADEPFVVDKADVTIVTVIYTKSGAIVTGDPIASTTIIYDKATVTGIGVAGFPLVGYVDFSYDSTSAGSFFIGGDPVTVKSNDVGPLPASSYAFKAKYRDYSGDYNDRSSDLEPFSVVKVAKGTEGSKGLWTNKNGQAMLTLSDAAALNGEAPFQRVTPPTYPKEVAGCTPFNTASLNTFKSQVLNFLKPANAVDMRYMLAAQLLAAKLDYRHGFWPSSRIWIDANGDGIVQPGEVSQVADLFQAADNAWSTGTRASQEYYKNMMERLALAKYWFVCL